MGKPVHKCRREELQALVSFHSQLVQYFQTITAYVDTKDRSEHIATLVNFVRSGLSALADGRQTLVGRLRDNADDLYIFADAPELDDVVRLEDSYGRAGR